MADHRHHPPRHARRWYRSPLASWTAWFVAIAGATAGWSVTTFDAVGIPSPTTLPVLWISPAALVILAVWWNGARGAAIATVAVTAGALVPTATGDATPFTAAQWVLLALAAVAGPTVAAAGLRRAHADLRRPGLFDTGRFVAVVVAATVASGGATVALLALWGRTPPDAIAAVRSLAITDLSAIVVVVPVAFVTRGAGARRRTRSARPSRPRVNVARITVHGGVLLAVVALVVAISNGGTRVDVAIGASVALALAAFVEERRRSEAATRRALGDLALDRARFRSLVDDSTEGVLVLDALGRVESVNRGAAEIFGSAPDQLVGRSLLELLPVPAGVDPAMHLVEVLGSRGVSAGFGGHADGAWDAEDVDGHLFAIGLSVSRVDVGGRWGYIATVRGGRDRRRREQIISRRATHDRMTDLPNRVLFQDRLERALSALRHQPGELALLLVALDRSPVDHALGHAAGDEVVAEAARRLLAIAQPSDTIARLAADQIIVCRPLSGAGDVEALAAHIVDALGAPYAGAAADIHPVARLGITTTADADVAPDRLLRDVDAAVARAGRLSTDPWCVYDPALDDATIDLREPIGDDRIVVRYQPTLDLATGHAVSIEAVARLRCDNGTLITPDDHPALWERTGFRPRLGAIVLTQALAHLVSLREELGSEQLRLAVDVSPAELTPDLCDVVRAALARNELGADSLLIEITEAAPIDTMTAEIEILRELRALGIGIVLDHFGTGFTRLDLIRDPPVDSVKIDRSFVGRMVESPVDHDIVETIVTLAQRRNLTVIADGVESVEQVDALARLGCSQAQGPLFGRPVDVEELRYLLREWGIVPAIATTLIRTPSG